MLQIRVKSGPKLRKKAVKKTPLERQTSVADQCGRHKIDSVWTLLATEEPATAEFHTSVTGSVH